MSLQSTPPTPQTHQLSDFVGGWLVGHFNPSLVHSDHVEIAVKKYRCGDVEPRHHHRVATEYTLIASGRVRMNELEYREGEIVEIQPGTSTNFEVLEDTITVVIKTPSVPNDKFLDEEIGENADA